MPFVYMVGLVYIYSNVSFAACYRMDPKTCYNLEIRIIAYNTRSKWFSFSKVVDADTTNFKDLVDEILDKYPSSYGDLVKLFYYAADTKSNIELSTDQELLAMFAKHVSTKTCYLSIAYYPSSAEPPAIPIWDTECVDVPSTPSMLVPLAVDPSHCFMKKTADRSEINADHMGVDLEMNMLVWMRTREASTWILADKMAQMMKRQLMNICLKMVMLWMTQNMKGFLTLTQTLTQILTLTTWRMKLMQVSKISCHLIILK